MQQYYRWHNPLGSTGCTVVARQKGCALDFDLLHEPLQRAVALFFVVQSFPLRALLFPCTPPRSVHFLRLKLGSLLEGSCVSRDRKVHAVRSILRCSRHSNAPYRTPYFHLSSTSYGLSVLICLQSTTDESVGKVGEWSAAKMEERRTMTALPLLLTAWYCIWHCSWHMAKYAWRSTSKSENVLIHKQARAVRAGRHADRRPARRNTPEGQRTDAFCDTWQRCTLARLRALTKYVRQRFP